MSETIYVCPSCGSESNEPGICFECDVDLVPTCAACWHPLPECTCKHEPEEGF